MKIKKILIAFFVTGLVVTAGAAALGYKWYRDGLQAVGGDKVVRVVIPNGSSTKQIAKILRAEGLIRNETAFEIYVSREAKDTLRSGSYKLSSSQTAYSISNQLAEGRVDTRVVTIPPGVTIDFLKQRFKKEGFSDEQIKAALEKEYTSPLLKFKPNDRDLEGYIFPDTYVIDSDTSLDKLIEQSFATFYKKIETDNAQEKLKAKGLNLDQAINLASIIQQRLEALKSSKRWPKCSLADCRSA